MRVVAARVIPVAIERRQDWGTPGRLAPRAPTAIDDASLAQLVVQGVPEARVLGGDLARTLGVNDQSLRRPEQMRLPIDVMRIRLDGADEAIGVAHVIVGRVQTRPSAAIMNAAFVGRRNLAPRAHPGDGQLDVLHFELGLVDWFKASRRMPAGTHLPHPGIRARRASETVIELDEPVQVRIDGGAARRAERVECTLWPDAIVVGV